MPAGHPTGVESKKLPGTVGGLVDALTLARFLTLVFALYVAARGYEEWERPLLGGAALLFLTAWTVAVAFLDRRYPQSKVLSGADLTVATVLVLLSSPVQGPYLSGMDVTTLPTIWVATSVAAWALRHGRRGGILAALVIATADVVERGALTPETLRGAVMLVVIGAVIGFLARLAAQEAEAMRELARKEVEAAARNERDRLVRVVHDCTLQDLALIARTAPPEEARLARNAEARLRNLLSGRVDPGRDDLVQAIRDILPSQGELSSTSEVIRVAPEVLEELVAATGEALRNAAEHAPGAAVQVFVDDYDGLSVTIRDDGPGIPEGRLERAEAEGRLGVKESIRGRMEALGGTTEITSSAEGTEVELCLPGSSRTETATTTLAPTEESK